MLVQRHTRLVVGMSSVTKRGLGVKYKPVRNYCKSKDCEKFLVHIISPIFKIANLISQ